MTLPDWGSASPTRRRQGAQRSAQAVADCREENVVLLLGPDGDAQAPLKIGVRREEMPDQYAVIDQ